ncbi:MAG: hypothetical protein ACP5OU_07160, partial [Methanothrix sp.]
ATDETADAYRVTDEDPSHYYGELGLIKIKKYTNGDDADRPPGPNIPVNGTVTWRYEITTESDVPIHEVNVTDSDPGVTPYYVSGDEKNDGQLTRDETWIYEAKGIAVAGQYSNMGYVTGEIDDAPRMTGYATDETADAYRVTDEDPSHYYGELGLIKIKKYTNGDDADYPPGPSIAIGENVTWEYVITTASNLSLFNVTVSDNHSRIVPRRVGGDDNNDGLLTKDEIWVYEATGIAVAGQYANIGKVTGEICDVSKEMNSVSSMMSYVAAEAPDYRTVTDEDPSHYYGGCDPTITKTADKSTASRGEEITYTITLSNPCVDIEENRSVCFTNVTIWDVLPPGVEVVSVSPPPTSSSGNTLYWYLGTVCEGEFKIQIVVRVPDTEIRFDMEQGVHGEGFTNVHNDYDTHQGPESITNHAYFKADFFLASDSVTVEIVDPGTEILRREFGSGCYQSEETLRLRTENKSIRSATSLSASYQPLNFTLPGGRSITCNAKWMAKSKAINPITGATMNEEYNFASKINKEHVVELDRNGSTMKTDVEFIGAGHIGVLKKQEPDSHPRVTPTFEGVEDYTGSFRIYELVDEYGSAVRSEKNVSGYGYVAVDKRIGESQRSYESGTGSYQSEELIETPTNYMAKDIRLIHAPTNFRYTPSFATSQDLKWTEGMWSRSGRLAGGVILAGNSSCPALPTDCGKPATYISERHSNLDYLRKESVAAGLNQMDTSVVFSGQADYEVKAIYANRSGEIDDEERYVGAYNINRHVVLTGVSRYDRPHITVIKEGNRTTRFFNKTLSNIGAYSITITNDGNRALAPIRVRDIFPPGTEYIGSTVRPTSYTNTEANWTLLHLGIGDSITIGLDLNVTDYASCSLVNRVMVCGMNGETCVSGAAYNATDCGELPCCPPEIRLEKSADLDGTDPTLIHYAIVVQNNANSAIAATLTDSLPAGVAFIDASVEPNIQSGLITMWIVPEIEPGGQVVIEYRARAGTDGSFVNNVHLDATAVDGTGYMEAYAAARVDIRSTGVLPRTTRYGDWQVPDWNITTPDQGITIDLSPEEDMVGE